MQRGELSIGRAFPGISLAGAIGALVLLALIALFLIQLAGPDGHAPFTEQADQTSAPQTTVAGYPRASE